MLSEFKFTEYYIALQNLAYLQMQDQQPPYIQISVLKGGTEGFFFLIEEIFKTIY